MTKAGELRELHDEELENRLADASQELFNLRFQHVTGQLDNYSRLSEVRRELARVNTLLREREIAAAEAQASADAGPVAEEPEQDTPERKRRRARVLASRRGIVAGVGAEAATAQQESDERQAGEEPNDG